MSFKDVRDLAEQLKLLGFPRVFPLQALATPHGSLASFHIVAEVLQWLAGMLEPGAVLPGGVDSEEARVLLIRSATEFFVTKSAVRLNPRKLYAAAMVTATELQKITRILIAPAQSDGEQDEEEQQQQQLYRSLNQVDIGDKMEELRRARELSTDLTQRGTALHDLLSKELLNKEARLTQANRPMELNTVERNLKNAIASVQVRLQSSRAQLESSRVEMNALNSKLQRKRAELERTKQRLDALRKIRPAHMQEFEDCEKELQDLFQQYFLRLHVRDCLRAQLEARNKRATPAASPIQQKPAENSIPFIPEGLIEDDDDDEEELDANGMTRRGKYGLDAEIPDIRDEDLMLRRERNRAERNTSAGRRPGTATSRIRPTTGRSRKATGAAAATRDARDGREGPGSSMLSTRANIGAGAGAADEDEDSSFGSSDSELDVADIMDLSGLGVSGAAAAVAALNDMSVTSVGVDDFDLNSMDDISISKLTGELPMRPKTASKPEHHSDEDF